MVKITEQAHCPVLSIPFLGILAEQERVCLMTEVVPGSNEQTFYKGYVIGTLSGLGAGSIGEEIMVPSTYKDFTTLKGSVLLSNTQ